MKRLALYLGIVLFLTVAFLQAGSKSGQQQNNTPLSYTGDIIDSNCTLMCIKDPSKFVLYSKGAKTSYNLDDQDKPQQYAGEKVTIIGTYDGETKTIHIQSIIATP
jgi:hypothetical protein